MAANVPWSILGGLDWIEQGLTSPPSIKSLILSFNIQSVNFVHKFINLKIFKLFLSFSQKFSRSLRSLDCVLSPT